ncbi:MAG: bifunctional DNA-formamidopyrimidine glycosylase/DNA-(apurinic or apyrimidinic site) lyase [Caldiserica bacterium]|nr:bifunctional DNA-formamidopyrimidine glycosylase/DNA-(apurinic or apyrimidinic site) lyase [Caldisericota bacterium]
MPEVETIRKDLEAKIGRRVIRDIDFLDPDYFSFPPQRIKNYIRDKCFEKYLRRGKYIIMKISPGYLIVHLGMTGLFRYYPGRNSPPAPSTRMLLAFQDGSELHYQDTRKFGHVWWSKDYSTHPPIEKLGPEPLSPEFSLDWFKESLAKRSVKIKPLLLDQSFLSGLGNIYACEVLFRAGIHPARKAAALSGEEAARLFQQINEVIEEAIKYRGSSIDTYCDLAGEKGAYESRLLVYGRADKPCFRCRTPIKMIKLSGRGTYFCPLCQK